MRTLKSLAVLALVVGGLMSVGCASTPYAKFGFDVYEKNGRIYVFHPGSPASEQFEKTHEFDKGVTLIGAGPDGKTIVGEDREVIDSYLSQ